MDVLTKGIQNEIQWHMLFVGDIALINEIKDGLSRKLEQRRHTLKSRELRLTRSKTKYLKCGFSGEEAGGEEVTIGGVTIPRAKKFRYLGSTIEEKEDIE